ncbi:MAG: hypothetical protein CM1200mP41_39930 [Gammaproteobacteria bacterium]|nr:MAG: hypothetical protein CM1200mP41_39930 [Gammaproteobacteria bacterium]
MGGHDEYRRDGSCYPHGGLAGDSIWRTRLILFSVLGFALSSLACGLAQSLDELVFYRVLQGGFGAPLVPITQTIVQSSFSPTSTWTGDRGLGYGG